MYLVTKNHGRNPRFHFKESFATDVQSTVKKWVPKHKVCLATWYLGYSPKNIEGYTTFNIILFKRE